SSSTRPAPCPLRRLPRRDIPARTRRSQCRSQGLSTRRCRRGEKPRRGRRPHSPYSGSSHTVRKRHKSLRSLLENFYDGGAGSPRLSLGAAAPAIRKCHFAGYIKHEPASFESGKLHIQFSIL